MAHRGAASGSPDQRHMASQIRGSIWSVSIDDLAPPYATGRSGDNGNRTFVFDINYSAVMG